MKSTAGFVLCLIGGIFSIILSLIVGILTLLFGILAMSIPQSSVVSMETFSRAVTIICGIGALWFLVLGILTIIFSIDMNNEDKAKKGSLWCLIFGILSINIFAIIGGIIGLVGSGKQSNIVPVNPQTNSLYLMSSSNIPTNRNI